MKTGLPGTALHLFDDLRHHDPHQEQAAPLPTSLALSLSLDVCMLLLNLLPTTFILSHRQQRHLPMDHVVLALSITHVLAAILPSPLLIVTQHPYACYAYQFLVLWFQLVAINLISVLSVERWIALRQVISNHGLVPGNNDTCRMRWVIITLYLVCLFIASLPFYGLAPSIVRHNNSSSCEAWVVTSPQRPQEHVFCFFYLVLGYVNVLVVVMVNTSQVISVCQYVRLASVSSKQHVHIVSGGAGDKRQILEFVLMVLLVTTLFHLTWIPALVLLTLHHAYVTVPPAALTYTYLANTLTALLNPVFYAVVSRTYRAGYVTLLSRAVQAVRRCGRCWTTRSQTGTGVIPPLISRRSGQGSTSNSALLPSQTPPENTHDTGRSNFTTNCACVDESEQRIRVQQNYQLSFITETMEDENCEDTNDETVQLCRYTDDDFTQNSNQQMVTYHPIKDNISYEE